MRFLVGDDRRYRGLGAGACGGGDGDEGGYLVHDLEQTRHLVDGAVRVNDSCRCALCGIHRGAAADRKEGVAAVFKIHLLYLVYNGYGGVCGDLRVVNGLDSDGVQ